jgi:sulfite exporter TauE/SafE
VAAVRQAGTVGGPFALGATTGLLPCGVVYLAAVEGALSASPVEGGVWMASFGLGTVPVLGVVGLLGREIVGRLGGRRLRHAGAALVIATGLFTMWRALAPVLAAGAGGEVPCCH